MILRFFLKTYYDVLLWYLFAKKNGKKGKNNNCEQ